MRIGIGLCVFAACASEPAPPEIDVIAMGATCFNGAFDPDELCVTEPGTLVVDTGTRQVLTVLAVHLDADPFRDIVALTSDRVYVRYGLAAGFGVWGWTSTAGAVYTDIAAADVDNDGDLDLAITDAATDTVIIRGNTGGVAFPIWTSVPVGDNPVRILPNRFGPDARTDFVVLSTGADVATVLLSPFVGPGSTVVYPVGDAADIALGDCDADGFRDLMYATGRGTSARLNARRNSTSGVLGAPLVTALPLFDALLEVYLTPYTIAAGDFDNDGVDEAVVGTSESRLATTTSDGDCTFTTQYTPATMNNTWAWVRSRLRTVDWNDDGNLDLGAPHGHLDASPSDEVYTIAYGDGTGRFPSYVIEDFPANTVVPKDLAFYDASGDGRIDVLVGADAGVRLERRIP